MINYNSQMVSFKEVTIFLKKMITKTPVNSINWDWKL